MMRLVGAGVGRTGTHSLKLALEQLLGAPCYHMVEVFQHPGHVAAWHAAARGEPVDWDAVFDGFVATVDWPGAAYWRELSERYPDAVVLLSMRDDAEAWWRSASRTIFEGLDRPPPEELSDWHAMVVDMLGLRFSEGWRERDAAMAAYERHNAEVRAGVPPDRLVEWRPGDGWVPLCDALGVPVPDDPFPHVNTTDDFRTIFGLDTPAV